MYIFILDIIQTKFFTTCSDIPFLIPVGPKNTIYARDQHITSDIKLSFVIKERSFNIQLNNVSFLFSIQMPFFRFYQALYVREVVTDCDTVPSIRYFPWFNYPNIFLNSYFLPSFLILLNLS